ncbi:MAG: F0F1 ATP synthase subunit B [Eubacteriales bacterium]|nr:F0F1 ATP synthase subunit B [Eubacteriales bacterium]MDY2934396.1 F0F1 ATP synthase subunit B [Anaerovoracaceae bacterium]
MLDALGINLKDLIFAVANFLILVLILGKFLYKPFLGILEKRKQTIEDAFTNAEATNRKADEKYEAYTKKLARAEAESREIIKNARLKADDHANMIVEEAKAEATRIKLQAEKEAVREKEKALREVREQIGQLAILAAEQILEKEVAAEGQEEIIDRVLEKAGTSQWQN